MTTPTFHPGDQVRVRAETAKYWIDNKVALRIARGFHAKVIAVYGTALPPERRDYLIRFSPIRTGDAGLTATVIARDLEPAP